MNAIFKLSLSQALFMVAVFLFCACSDDDSSPSFNFGSGLFVINEGNFGSANGSITHYDITAKAATPAVFSSANGALLGDVVQSATVVGNRAFLVVNNSNKVEVVNVNTFVREHTIDLELPRYMVAYRGKAYITEWVSFTDNGRVSVVDLDTYEVEETIEAGEGAEYILELDDLLYVSNSFANTISVIDPDSNTVIDTITLSSGVTQMVTDENDKIWAVGGNGEKGKLFRIDPLEGTVEDDLELSIKILDKLAINNDGDELYLLTNKSVFAVPVSLPQSTLEALVTESDDVVVGFYGIGIDPEDGTIYVGDNKGFEGNGEIFMYEPDGDEIGSFDAGIGPNGFIFR